MILGCPGHTCILAKNPGALGPKNILRISAMKHFLGHVSWRTMQPVLKLPPHFWINQCNPSASAPNSIQDRNPYGPGRHGY